MSCRPRRNVWSGRFDRPAGVRLAAFFSLAVLLSGCGYHVAGRAANLPSTWHTIAVPALVNKTPQYRIEQRMTEAVIRELISRTKYRVVQDPNSADAVLHGEVVSIETSPILFDARTGQVTTMLVTIHAQAQLVDNHTQQTVYTSNDLVFRDEYQITADIRSFFEEKNPAIERMSRDFAVRFVSDVMENF